MRILHVTHQYAPATGGAENYITDLSAALVRHGHNVDVFTSRSTDYRTWNNTLPRHETVDGVRIRRFGSVYRGPLTWRMLRYGYSRYFRHHKHRFEPMIFMGNGPVMPSMFAALLRHAREYDVMHINNLHYAQALTAAKAAHLCNVPVVLSPLIHIDQPLTHQVGYMLKMLQEADGIIALTDAERDYIQAMYPDQRVTVAGVGLDPEQFPALNKQQSRMALGIPEDAFVILFLGRKTDYKRLDLVIGAFERLVKQAPHAWLLAAGPETASSQSLMAYSAKLPNVVWRGYLDNTDRLGALASADVLVMPSLGESFGIVYLEAWAYCLPVIGARIEAVASLIDDGVNGILSEPGDVQSVYDGLEWLVHHRLEASKMGQAGHRKLLTRYHIDRITDIVEGAYVRAMRFHRTRNGIIA